MSETRHPALSGPALPGGQQGDHLMSVLLDVAAERGRQDAKWGADRDYPHGMWALILGEEYGEACEAVLEIDEFNPGPGLTELRAELVQVAAVAVAWIEAIDGGRAWLAAKGERDE